MNRKPLTVAIASLFAIAMTGCNGGGGGGTDASNSSVSGASTTGTVQTGGTATTAQPGAGAGTSTTTSPGATSTTGGATSGSTGTSTTPVVVVPTPASDLTADCSSCGAVNSNTYSGSGVGVWSKANTTTVDQTYQASVGGLKGNTVSIVLTNTGSTDVTLPMGNGKGIASAAEGTNQVFKTMSAADTPILKPLSYYLKNATDARKHISSYTPNVPYAVGDKRAFNTTDSGGYAPMQATLHSKASLSNGGAVHIWLADADASKVTQATMDSLAAKFAASGSGVYDALVRMVGEPWGTKVVGSEWENSLLGSQEKNIHIFIQSLPNQYNTLGFFWALNLIRKAAQPASNEMLMLTMNADRLQSEADMPTAISTLAHEMTHLVNAYTRDQTSNLETPDWMKEVIAMGAEEMISSVAITGNSQYAQPAALRFNSWLNSVPCGVDDWSTASSSSDTECSTMNSYAIGGSFASFLTRQYGSGVWKSILASKASGWDSIDEAIKKVNSQDSATSALRRWASSAAMTSVSVPVGYGFPAKDDGVVKLAAFDLGSSRTRRTFTTPPATLKAHASVTWKRGVKYDVYSEKLTLPAGVSATLVVN